ncbi:MAG TPA: hypothetical protein VFZ11_07345 [Gemmatimonadaceae bacterium]
MRSHFIRGAVPLLALAALAACGDVVAPVGTPEGGPALASVSRFGRVNADVIVDLMAADSLSADITVTPTGGWFRLGNHGIFFPDHAICDPATSSYGVGHWDEPCDVLDQPIQIHAEVRTQDGRSWVDFTPALRFAPSADSTQWVQIYLYSDGALDPDNLPEMTILWSSGIGDPGVDESVDDATQRTFVDIDHGIAFRRIKHFSGYSVSSGIRSSVNELTGALGL